MFWIFRRSKLSQAAGFFSSLNNNNNNNNRSSSGCGSGSTGSSNNNISGVNNNKKGYNKLSGEEVEFKNEANNNNINNNEDNSVWRCTASGPRSTDDHITDSDSSCSDFGIHEEEDFSDDSDFDESLTCNVCDRSFPTSGQLARHQQKKRHFGCMVCDSLFTSLMDLEHHKEQFDHWSGDDISLAQQSDDDDDDESIQTVCSEEMERLL